MEKEKNNALIFTIDKKGFRTIFLGNLKFTILFLMLISVLLGLSLGLVINYDWLIGLVIALIALGFTYLANTLKVD